MVLPVIQRTQHRFGLLSIVSFSHSLRYVVVLIGCWSFGLLSQNTVSRIKPLHLRQEIVFA